MTKAWRGWAMIVVPLAGCVPPTVSPPTFARLDGVLVDVQPEARPAQPSELGRVVVTRDGNAQPATESMDLHKGDALHTTSDGVGVMTLAAGYEVILEPGTDLTIENPSLFVRIGKVIIRKVKAVVEKLTVHTEFGAAAVEGTEFVVEVKPNRETEVTVLEGRVKVYGSATSAWRDTSLYVAGERGTLTAQRSIRMATLTPQATTVLRSRITQVERITKTIPRAGLRATYPGVARPDTASTTSLRTRATIDPSALTRRTCTVPALLQMTEAEARKALAAGRWGVGTVKKLTGTTVTSQEPAGTTEAACGTQVSFVVGSSRAVRDRRIP